MTARPPAPVALAGRYVMLEPLRIDHVPDLFAAQRGLETDWGWLPVSAPRTLAEMRLIVEQRLAQQAAGAAFLFVVLDARTRRPVGWIAYLNIGVIDQRLDIGWHWIGGSLADSDAAVEIHVLLVQHAFDLGFTRVQWQLDDLDRAGHNTMRQIGAVREGLLQRHLKRPDGTWRDTVLYAVLTPSRATPPGGFGSLTGVPATSPGAGPWPAPAPLEASRPRLGLPPAGNVYRP